MPSQTEENYLKALLTLSAKDDSINISELSHVLDVSTPTANSMVKKLAAKGLVKYEKYKPLEMTLKGKRAAALVLRKHRLTEMFLVSQMGFGWGEVHEIAEQIEHIKSSVFFDRMDRLMGYPKVDPHGSPIPDKNGKIEDHAYNKLSETREGDRITIKALNNSSKEFIDLLNSKGLTLGLEMEVLSIEPFDQSMKVRYVGHSEEFLSNSVCQGLWIEKSKIK